MYNKKIEDLHEKLPEQYKPLAKLTGHYFAEIDKKIERHRKEVAMNAVAGIKPDLVEEKAYQDTVRVLKNVMIHELEKTLEEIEHAGDKHWIHHYNDGIK
jgi:glutamyl-tRNA reductase